MTAWHDATEETKSFREPAGRSAGRNAAPQRLKVRDGLRVISVTSGKAGAGKSAVVVNLADSLAALGKRVLIVDADLGVGDIPLGLGLEAKFTLQHVLSGQRCMRDILIDAGGGVSILPAGMAVHHYSALTPKERFFLLQGMVGLQDSFDFFLIDSGAGFSANVTGLAAIAKEIMMVVTPDPTSFTDAYSLMKTLAGRDETLKFRVVANRCRTLEEGEALFARLSAISGRFLKVSLEFWGSVMQDGMVLESAKRRGSLCRLFPDSIASLGFRGVAQKMIDDAEGEALLVPQHVVGSTKQWRKHELPS